MRCWNFSIKSIKGLYIYFLLLYISFLQIIKISIVFQFPNQDYIQCLEHILLVETYLFQGRYKSNNSLIYLNINEINCLREVFFFLINLFIFFGCVGSSLLRTGFLYLWQAGATLCCGVRASHCCGFSICGAWAPDAQASVVAAHWLSSCGSWALECKLSSCGARAQLLHGM